MRAGSSIERRPSRPGPACSGPAKPSLASRSMNFAAAARPVAAKTTSYCSKVRTCPSVCRMAASSSASKIFFIESRSLPLARTMPMPEKPGPPSKHGELRDGENGERKSAAYQLCQPAQFLGEGQSGRQVGRSWASSLHWLLPGKPHMPRKLDHGITPPPCIRALIRVQVSMELMRS